MLQEHEILNAWLTDLGFEEYYDLFVQSGYDMHTITRMTPEVSINLNYVTQLRHHPIMRQDQFQEKQPWSRNVSLDGETGLG